MSLTALAPLLHARTQATTTFQMEDSDDLDADGEEVEEEEVMVDAPGDDQEEDAEGTDPETEADSESEDEEEVDEDEDTTVGVSRIRKYVKGVEGNGTMAELASDAEESSAAEGENDSDKVSSDEESVAASAWEEGGSNADNASVVATRNNCVFCEQDEEHDPSEDFEEYMSCAVCGDNSHRQCARDAKSLKEKDDPAKWRCLECVENALEPSTPEETISRRRSSATKFTRDLLPAPRGGSRPGSHSVFNNLILDDDPLDGSRSLRKRKASSEQRDEPKKRPRNGSAHSALAAELKAAGIIRIADGDIAEADDEEDVEVGSTSTRKSRPSRSSKKRKSDLSDHGFATIIERSTDSIIVSIRLERAKLASLPKSKPKKKRPRPRESTVETQRDRERPVPSFNGQYATPFYAFHERENDELKSKPYGGVLSEADADTSRTLPLQADRVRFNEARQKAEDDWKLKVANSEVEGETKARTQKLAGPPSKIKCVNFGGFEIETWYAAPYPEEYSRNRVLFICEFCLKYMNSDFVAWRHKLKCPAKHPPGDEIYREGSISVFEVDGRKNPVYCQNLCLLAKLFLGSKTLYYDVEPFLFYVMTEHDEFGCHFVGYFSKEKRPSSPNNVSCILTLPTHQRKGYGNLLISFSYLLTRVEGKTGSPEKPLSDMGLVSYRNYWRLVLSQELIDQKGSLSILELSDRTGMTPDDIIAALEGLRALVRDPVTKTYALRLDYDYFNQCIDEWEAKKYVTINEDSLVWTPYIMGRSNLAHYETAPPLPTVAPREDDMDEKQIVLEEGVQQTAQADFLAAEVIKAGDNTVTNGDGMQHQINGNASDSSKHSQLQDIDDIDPAISQFEGSTPMFRQLSFTTPAKPSLMWPSGVNGTISTPAIPPIRYEVFPPIPGTTARRRGGWRGGPRKSGVNGVNVPNTTPSMRRSGAGLGKGKGNAGPGKSAGKTAAARRTRLDGPVDERPQTPKDDESSEEEEEEEAAVNEDYPTALADKAELPDDEKDAEGDDVIEDADDDDDAEGDDDEGVIADADFDVENAEESEGESEEDAMDD